MNRRRFLYAAAGTGSLIALRRAFPVGLERVEQKSRALGAEVSLVVYHEDRSTAKRALAAAFHALDDIENVLSLYRPESQICRLNREGSLDQSHPDLVEVLQQALNWSQITHGAFDPTVQPLWELFSRSSQPEPEQFQLTRRRVDWKSIRLDGRSIRLGPGQSITLNGIAQGFAADRVQKILQDQGIRYALANTGEFSTLGGSPEGDSWKIGIQHPRIRDAYAAIAAIENRFLATSGDYETTFTGDFASNHIFDPATGRSPTTLSSVTVVAPTGLEADALSTAIFVLGPERGLQLASSRNGVEVLMILKNGDILSSPSFPRLS